jgi:DNA invertase Pin-like site-specific DNA recombinase
MRFFIYARKSTEDDTRQVLSIDAQLDELRLLAGKERLDVAHEYLEAQTAKEPGRPIFNEMMQAIEKGNAHAILAWHPDRLARNSIDGGRIIYDLDTGKLAALKFPTFLFENTPQGKFILQVAFGQSKYYVDNLSENIKRGIRKKLRDGIYPNMPPPGYVNDRRSRMIVFDDERAPLLRRMFETYATGQYTVTEIAAMIQDWGLVGVRGKPIAPSKVHDILANPFYVGVFRFRGEMYEGKHPPLVSRELFDRVQKVRKNRGRGRYTRRVRYPFRGLIECPHCGCAITADEQKGHSYYRCGKRRGPCELKTMREEALMQFVAASMPFVSIRDELADPMFPEVETWRRNDAARRAELLARHKAELARVTERLNRLLDVFIDGSITKEDFTSHKERLVQEKTTLADLVAHLESNAFDRFKPLIDFITASRQAKYDALTDNPEELRNWHKKVGSKLILAAGILSGGGVSGSADGQETETDGSPSTVLRASRNAAQSRSLTDGLRGGSAARFRLRSEAPAGQAPLSEREKKAENKAVSGLSADGVTVTRSASGEWSEFIPILPADVAALSAVRQAAGGQPVTLFRSLGSKTDPVLHVRFPRPWSVVESNKEGQSWRPEAESRKAGHASGQPCSVSAPADSAAWRRLLSLVRTSVLGDE